jgi:hypothetical protein
MEPTQRLPAGVPARDAPGHAAESVIGRELGAIETAPLDELLDVRKSQARLAELSHRAGELQAGVPEAVARRVMADYQARAEALERQAAPLVVKVRDGMTAVAALLARVASARDAARIDQDEVEFRHRVGEITDAERDARLEHTTREIARTSADFDAVTLVHARFVEALGAEPVAAAPAAPRVTPASEVPTAPPPAAPVKPAAAVAPPPIVPGATSYISSDLAALIVPDLDALLGRTPAKSGPPPARVAANGGDVDATVVIPPAPPPVPRTAPRRLSGANPSEAQTFILPAAALVVTPEAGSPVEYRLAAMNTLGRSEDNQIQISTAGVSRHHAQVVATASGFVLADLQSQNGTFVNGERVTEWALTDGDRVTIGDVELVYRRL